MTIDWLQACNWESLTSAFILKAIDIFRVKISKLISILSDEESPTGPTRSEFAFKKIYWQRSTQYHGEIPGASGGQRKIVELK